MSATIEVSRDEFEDLVERVGDLEDELQEERKERRRLEEENEDLRKRVDGLSKSKDSHNEKVAELQSREIEKGAHLKEENVYIPELEVPEGRVEQFQKEHGEYVRLPEQDDPLDRGGATSLAHADLLPIQQLARLDEDMIRANVSTIQGRLAVKVWQERKRDEYGLWRRGSGPVHEYFNASDLKSFILAQEDSINEDYAQKLVSRTISALKTFSRDRLGVQKKKRRKDGLRYQERRVVLKNDASIPGERNGGEDADSPGTAGVHGD